MFPAVIEDESQVQRKDYVFGVRGVAASKAWPLQVFATQPVINDQLGSQGLVLLGDVASRTVRAYQREADEVFTQSADGMLTTADHKWTLTENFLISSDTKHKRPRLPGHISFWFAWENFLGFKSELYQP